MKENALPDILENFQWLHAPGSGLGWGAWACILAGLILLAGAAWHFIGLKKPGMLSFAPPPHQVALRALKELRQRLSEDHQREFVVEVSQIVRIYIHARFGLRAPHRSTEEFLREIHAGCLLQDHHDRLSNFLAQCDLVKFAQGRVVLEEMNRLFECARQFVESTIPSGQSRSQPELVAGKAG